MYCNSCGGPVDTNQATCPRCGKFVGQPQVSRVVQHVKMLGTLWIAYAVFHGLGGMVLLIVANTIFGSDNYDGRHAAFLHPLLKTIAIFLFAKALGSLIAGIGLLERQDWARTMSLVMAFIALINVPFGTAIGVYTLWVFMSPQAESEYGRLSASA